MTRSQHFDGCFYDIVWILHWYRIDNSLISYDYFFDIVWILFWYRIDTFWYHMNTSWYRIDTSMTSCGYLYDIVWILLWYRMYTFFISYGWFFDIVYRCLFTCSGRRLVRLRTSNHSELNSGSKSGRTSHWGRSYPAMSWNENGWRVLFHHPKEKLNFF